MCLIAYKPDATADFSNNKFHNAANINRDGLGVMWVEDGRVQVEKEVGNQTNISKLYRKHKHKTTYALHLRFATHGTKDLDNCHPFQILDKDVHGKDLWMMHNGVIHDVAITDKTKSDTYHFVHTYMAMLLENNPELIYNDNFKYFVQKYIGGSNKLLFMDNEANVIIMNESSGGWREKCWLSSPHYTNNPQPKYQPPAQRNGSYGWGYNQSNNYDDDDKYEYASPKTPANAGPVVPLATKLPVILDKHGTPMAPKASPEGVKEFQEAMKLQEEDEKDTKAWEDLINEIENLPEDAGPDAMLEAYIKYYGEENGTKLYLDEIGDLPEGWKVPDEVITEEDKEAVLKDITKETPLPESIVGDRRVPRKTPLTMSSLYKASIPQLREFIASFPDEAADALADLIDERKTGYYLN